MKELLRTNDLVRLSWIEALLTDAGIGCLVLDQHTSLVEGSIGAIQRRLMVDERAHRRAQTLIADADSGRMTMPEDGGMPVSEDSLLGGRVRLRQPIDGARASIDPIFLAASVPVEPGHLVLDIGCGTGAAMLCVAAREPQCRVAGIERQRDLVRIAGDNIILNGMASRASVMVGDLLQPPPRISAGAFDHVIANPPYLDRARANETPNPGRAEATIEGDAELGDWVRFALTMVKSKGTVTFIHRADRIDAVLGRIAGRAGEVVVFPLWPGQGRPASRILVRARKQVAAPARLAVGLVLHEADGRFSPAAEAILRGGEALAL